MKEALNATNKIDAKNLKAVILLDLSNVYERLNNIDSAKMYVQKLIRQNANPLFSTRAYQSMANLYLKEGNLDSALINAQKAIVISKNNNIEKTLSEAYDNISGIYAIKKDFFNAYKYKSLYSEIKDSLLSSDNVRFQNELEIAYQNNKKQEEIEQLSKEKQINELKNQRVKITLYLLVIILFGMIFIGFLILKQNRLKSKQQAMELEQKLLRSQMNPHFIFNSISAIQNFILKNNVLEASIYLSDFAKLMRTVLNSSLHNLISLDEEIELITHYLRLQKLRFSGKFDYQINISAEIDVGETDVPPMFTQPFIENAVKHGIRHKTDGKGLIKITYLKKYQNLIVEIEDNGIGRKRSSELNNSAHKSKAIDITNQRIKLLTQKYKQKITFEIIDLYDFENMATGTLIRFILPLALR